MIPIRCEGNQAEILYCLELKTHRVSMHDYASFKTYCYPDSQIVYQIMY